MHSGIKATQRLGNFPTHKNGQEGFFKKKIIKANDDKETFLSIRLLQENYLDCKSALSLIRSCCRKNITDVQI